MTKEQAKKKIQKLIERYESLTPEAKRMNEATTISRFIRPLFEALGWNFEEDVFPENKVSKGRVDFCFKINGTTKFYVEAKPLKADLDDPKHIQQAINYAWLKAVGWAILTDFEEIKVFYPTDGALPVPAFSLKMGDYLKFFDELWLLSKDAFTRGEFDQYAERHGHKPTRIDVGKQLSRDLIEWRKHLTNQFRIANQDKKPISKEVLDEGVQKILDRLIFIRTCEDRGIETENKLRSTYRIWEDRGRKPGNFLASLTKLFDEYAKNYNSGLFEYHPCVEWEAFTDTFDPIIRGLYTTKNGQEYDFSAIGSDVMGAVYEQYLGYLQESPDVDATKKKRKSQGIYYTPAFVVEYIVQNTLGQLLKKKSKEEINDLKILDPACGSGSFLIRVFEYLVDYYEKEKNKPKFKKDTHLGVIEQKLREQGKYDELSMAQKLEILKKNIYGVDLDYQAIEITKLNLLLSATDREIKLPYLNNIKCGNSLIDNPKVAGDKAFNWQEEFHEVMKNDGFDVIIGNPPWGATLNTVEKQYFRKNYQTGRRIIDTFALFVEKSINFLKQDGILGLILPDIVLLKNYPEARKLILKTSKILEVFHTGMIFGGVNIDTVCIILQKTKEQNDKECKGHKIVVYRSQKDYQDRKNYLVNQKWFKEEDYCKFNLFFTPETLNLKKKLFKRSDRLGKLFGVHEGIHSGNIRNKLFLKEKINKNCKKLIFKGDEVKSYGLKWGNYFVNYSPTLIDKQKNRYANLSSKKFFENPKVLIRRTEDKVVATLDDRKYYVSNNLFTLTPKSKTQYSLKFILAILNSRLISWYFNFIQPRKGRLFAELKINHIDSFPLSRIDFSNSEEKLKHDELVKLAEKMLKLNEDLQSVIKGTNHCQKINSEIQKTDRQIDQMVYELYGLTPEEIKIVEELGK